MKISIGSKGSIQNQILFYESKTKSFLNDDIKTFVNSQIKLSEKEKFKVKTFQNNENGKIVSYVLVMIDSFKVYSDIEEDLIAAIGNQIKALDSKIFIDLETTKLNSKQKQIFEELIVHSIYEFTKYNGKKSKVEIKINDKDRSNKEFQSYIDATVLTKDLVNDPSSHVNPDNYENIIKQSLKGIKNIKIEVIKGKKLQKMGMNGIYCVGKGSEFEPRLVLITYKGSKNKKFDYGIVGKGITFDTGGYNLKPTGAIEDMSFDMAGSASVLGSIKYLAENKIEKNIIVGLSIADNMVSSNAYRPGDIIKMYNGKNIEIANTDAEGRLVMADAVSYIDEKYDPEYLFDMAILTGSQLIALGNKVAAIIGKNPKLNQKIQKLSWEIKERTWELPSFEPYFTDYKSQIADMKNVFPVKLKPGTICAGIFMAQFCENKNFIHFDIAGPAGTMQPHDELYGVGATGFGMRLLIEIIKTI